MLRDRRLGHGEVRGDLGGAQLPVHEEPKDLATLGLGDGLEHFHGSRILAEAYIRYSYNCRAKQADREERCRPTVKTQSRLKGSPASAAPRRPAAPSSPAGRPLNSRALAPIVADAKIPFTELDSMAATVPPDAPWEAAKAAEWDAMTVETWKQQNTFSPFGRFWMDLLVLVAGSTNPGDM